MGMISMEGSSRLAPLYIPDAGRAPGWCSKDVVDLTDDDVKEISRFCHQSGRETGWNAVMSNRSPSEAENPFHELFLAGAPRELWSLSYWRGVREAALSVDWVARAASAA